MITEDKNEETDSFSREKDRVEFTLMTRIEQSWKTSMRPSARIPFLERMRIGRFNLIRLSAAVAPHPSPLPRERELVIMYRLQVCCGGAYGLPGGYQKNPSL